MVRLTDRPDINLDVNHGRKTTKQQQHQQNYPLGACLIQIRLYLKSSSPELLGSDA